MFILGADEFGENHASSFYVLLASGLETAFFTGLMGGSFGKLLVRLRTVRADGKGYPTLLHALVRQVMVALLIPPLVFRPDGRGLHDMAAGTVTVRLKDIATNLGARG